MNFLVKAVAGRDSAGAGGKKALSANTTTLISRSTEITGDLHFSGTLEIEGRVFGKIYAADEAEAVVRVRESALVKGEIHAPKIVIGGLVEGDVYSSGHLELAARSRVTGNIFYHMLEMVRGAEVNGTMKHRPAPDLLPKAAEQGRLPASTPDDSKARPRASD